MSQISSSIMEELEFHGSWEAVPLKKKLLFIDERDFTIILGNILNLMGLAFEFGNRFLKIN